MLYTHTGLQLLYWTHVHCAHALSILHISLSTSDICIEYDSLQTLGKRSCSFPLFFFFMRGTKLDPDTFSLKPWREELNTPAKIRPLPVFPPSKSEYSSPCQPRGMWPQRNRTMSSAYTSPPQIKKNLSDVHSVAGGKLFLRKHSHSLTAHVLPSSQRDERQKVTNMNVLLEETASLWQEITAICEPLHGTHTVMTQRKFNCSGKLSLLILNISHLNKHLNLK